MPRGHSDARTLRTSRDPSYGGPWRLGADRRPASWTGWIQELYVTSCRVLRSGSHQPRGLAACGPVEAGDSMLRLHPSSCVAELLTRSCGSSVKKQGVTGRIQRFGITSTRTAPKPSGTHLVAGLPQITAPAVPRPSVETSAIAWEPLIRTNSDRALLRRLRRVIAFVVDSPGRA